MWLASGVGKHRSELDTRILATLVYAAAEAWFNMCVSVVTVVPVVGIDERDICVCEDG